MKNQQKYSQFRHISVRFMPGDGKSLNAVANLTFRKEEITFFYEKYAFNVLLETTQL